MYDVVPEVETANAPSKKLQTFKSSFCRCQRKISLKTGNLKVHSYAVITIFVVLILCFLAYHQEKILTPLRFNDNSCQDYALELAAADQVRTVFVKWKRRSTVAQVRSKKVILLWTKYFWNYNPNDYYFFPSNGSEYFERYICSFKECFVTSDRKMLKVADAILFHGIDIQDYPEHFHERQIKIIYNLEAPPTVNNNWTLKKDYFNWSMSYLSGSDILVQYGKFLFYDTGRKRRDYLENKIEGAVWVSSHCITSSNREQYVRELQKHYPVDIFGTCGTKVCTPRMSPECYEKLFVKYKFFLSFENCICDGYVSEKFFNILKYDIIPVVFGGANYKEIAPKNSYVDAVSFPNSKDLAAYLHKLGNDSVAYNSYFSWKSTASIHLDPWMCSLCEKLHNSLNRTRILGDPQQWFVNKSSCKKWTIDQGFKKLN